VISPGFEINKPALHLSPFAGVYKNFSGWAVILIFYETVNP
jgi:hypothetical protein